MKSMIYLVSFILGIIIYSCGPQYEPVYLRNIGDGDSTISIVQDEYFEIELWMIGGTEDGYAYKELSRNPQRFILIVNDDGYTQWFKGSTALLNYMSERGYEMQDQIERPSGVAYTFKRK